MKIKLRRQSFPASLDNLNDMIAFIREGAKRYGFDEDDIETIHLAAEEVLVNIISYAYSGETGDIDIAYTFDKNEGFRIELIDEGEPFDPTSMATPDVDAPLEDRMDSGLGIFLVKQLMDKVEYRRQGKWNILTFSKY